MTTASAIATAGLTKHYPGVQALTDLTLDVPEGSIYGFLGPNGAGKTTTLRILAGLTRPTRGAAAVAGIPVDAGPAYRQQVGFLAQEPRFYDWMTGRDTLRFVASLYPAGQVADDARISAVLERVGLADAADRRTATYSGGMRQRLGIAQALIGDPAVLLLDEPVSALDPIGRREVLDLMRELRGDVTVFYSTHILEDVQRVSDHVAILDGGRLVQAAPTTELLERFERDQLQVALGGADDSTALAVASLPGVASVEPTGREGEIRTYTVRVHAGATVAVQAAITRLAAERGLAVTENHLVRLGLEDVFLRLVNTKERAA
ncbi:MAG TPA: ABC transporter ATP-binding protein [Candidatus Limnocylindrales bacterium]|nr:ABC transporter ATP-binding protein [Candidatus Limnocylindrales bacterium]